MKIVTEDKAVEARTNDFLNDWERAKPVAGDLRPGKLTQSLNSNTLALLKVNCTALTTRCWMKPIAVFIVHFQFSH
jgi:hypothetical protein